MDLSRLYKQLPTELQLRVWEQTLEPRSLKIFDQSSRDKFFELYEDSSPPVVLQLWQRAVISRQYPDWRKAMSKLLSLETFSVISHEMMPKLDGENDKFKQAIERTLLSVQRENDDWQVPQVCVIRTGDVCPTRRRQTDQLDFVDFARGGVKEAYLLKVTRPRCSCSACAGRSALGLLSQGFPTARQILVWSKKDSQKPYTPHPSMFSIWPNDLATQAHGGAKFIVHDSTLVPASAMAILTFTSFMATTTLLEDLAALSL
ncbi:uncharacterized protein LY89DRAFT_767633 [Mollisia scopiformis]|uniref:Uncharacterized protein n=1 Tax=Mollisia scopiformis TaxID=149040 RepID=A0A194XN56_MOLSC|nr:uncharacterized protein LY89DRAFT_767633 [Mollisia scopiformis]KUJ21571.1 hypothetical protein LY89DRAFT_767633 [Mollisia scopiformis]